MTGEDIGSGCGESLAAPDAAGEARPQGIIDGLKTLGNEFACALRTGGELLAAESRLFLLSLLQILILAVAIGFLIAAVGLFLGAAGAFFMIQHLALSPVLALLLIAGILILLAAACIFWIYRLTGNLKFAHSRRAFSDFVAPPESPPQEEHTA